MCNTYKSKCEQLELVLEKSLLTQLCLQPFDRLDSCLYSLPPKRQHRTKNRQNRTNQARTTKNSTEQDITTHNITEACSLSGPETLKARLKLLSANTQYGLYMVSNVHFIQITSALSLQVHTDTDI